MKKGGRRVEKKNGKEGKISGGEADSQQEKESFEGRGGENKFISTLLNLKEL